MTKVFMMMMMMVMMMMKITLMVMTFMPTMYLEQLVGEDGLS